jgi:hypothetical protein
MFPFGPLGCALMKNLELLRLQPEWIACWTYCCSFPERGKVKTPELGYTLWSHFCFLHNIIAGGRSTEEALSIKREATASGSSKGDTTGRCLLLPTKPTSSYFLSTFSLSACSPHVYFPIYVMRHQPYGRHLAPRTTSSHTLLITQ